MIHRIADWVVVHALNGLLQALSLGVVPHTFYGLPGNLLVGALFVGALASWSLRSSDLGSFKVEALSCGIGTVIFGAAISAITVFDYNYFDAVKLLPVTSGATLLSAMTFQWLVSAKERGATTNDWVVALCFQCGGIVLYLIRKGIHDAVLIPQVVSGFLLEVLVTYPLLRYCRTGTRWVQRRWLRQTQRLSEHGPP